MGAGMNKNKIKLISKHLSYILRHRPDTIDLKLDSAGWADIDELITKSPKISHRGEIDAAVIENDKQRFTISDDGDRIRANQGHSIDVDLGLKSISPPDHLFHGTATRFLSPILSQGLKKMNRQHVHLSPDLETAAKVGRRHGKLVILEVNTRRMSEDGYRFFKSENGVWLTDHVPSEYLNERE